MSARQHFEYKIWAWCIAVLDRSNEILYALNNFKRKAKETLFTEHVFFFDQKIIQTI